VAKRLLKWFLYFTLGVVVFMGLIYGSLALSKGEPAATRPVFQQNNSRPLVIAHRGGAGIYPENTLYAFEHARDLGVDVIELDVRSTSDGTMIVLHDADVQRTTDRAGRVVEMTLGELKKLDAGYRFSPDGGLTFPFRASGIVVPTLREVFAALPKMKFNIEPKQQTPSLVKPLCEMIREFKMADKTVVGSFNQAIIDDFRAECKDVATSASPSEVSKFLAFYKTGLSESYNPLMQALQIPEYLGSVQMVTKQFVKAAKERNLQVHVWTVNETADMQRLLENGVDGIMTDYPDRLLKITRSK